MIKAIQKNKLFALLLMVIAPISSLTARYNEHSPLIDIPTLSNIAKKEFLNDYYGYLQTNKDFLEDPAYSNNRVILCDLDANFTHNGEILLNLIAQLEKTKDVPSLYLLKKLSRYFELEFHQYICRIDVHGDVQAKLFHAYHLLNNHTIKHNNHEILPFKTILTQVIISFFIIHNAKARFDQKKSSWVLAAEKFRKKLHTINSSLKTDALSAEAINNFIDSIEVYALTEPLIPTRKVARIVITALIIIAVTGTSAYLIHTLRPQWYEDIKNILHELSKNISEGFMVPVRAVAKETIAELNRNMEPMATNFSKGMVYKRVVPNPAANPEHPDYTPHQPQYLDAIKHPKWLEAMREPGYNDPENPIVPEWIAARIEDNLQQSDYMSLMATQFTHGLVTITGVRNPAYDAADYDKTTPQYLPHPQAGQAGKPHVVLNPAWRPEYIPAPNNNPALLPNPNFTIVANYLAQGLAYEQLVKNPLYNPEAPTPDQPEYIPAPQDPHTIPNQSMQQVAEGFGTNITTGLTTIQGQANPAYNPDIPEFIQNPQAGQPGQLPILRNPAYQPRYIPLQPQDPTRVDNPALPKAGNLLAVGLASQELMDNPFHNPEDPNPTQPLLVPVPGDAKRGPNQDIKDLGELLGDGLVEGLQHGAVGTAGSAWQAGGYNPLAWSFGGWNPFANTSNR